MDVKGYALEAVCGADYYILNNLLDFIYADIGFDKSNKECQYFDDLQNLKKKVIFDFQGFMRFFGGGKKFFWIL